MAGKFLSLEDAARQLGISIDEVNLLVDRKKLFPMRDGATLKFKLDEVERVAQSLGEESSQSGNLSLELDTPEIASPPAPAASGLGGPETEDILLGDAIDVGDSIFSPEPSALKSLSQTIVRGDAAGGSVIGASNPSSLSMPSVAGASAADIVFENSGVGGAGESEDLALESIVGMSSIGASSPSMSTPSGPAAPGSAVSSGSDATGTLSIDLADLGDTPGGSSLAIGSAADLAAKSAVTGAGAALSGVLDSGLSLEDGDIQMSGIDLGAVGEEATADGGTILAGDDFDLKAGVGDDESASVVIATESESGDSSFFGQTMVGQGSSFSDESQVPSSVASEMLDLPYGPANEMTFTIWQTLGLLCCSLLLLFGGFIAYDLVRTIGSSESTTLANPLLNAMADTFGWR
jgi:hypothetical protein